MGFSLLFMKQFIVGFDVFIIYLSVNITMFVEGMEDSCLILRSSPQKEKKQPRPQGMILGWGDKTPGTRLETAFSFPTPFSFLLVGGALTRENVFSATKRNEKGGEWRQRRKQEVLKCILPSIQLLRQCEKLTILEFLSWGELDSC